MKASDRLVLVLAAGGSLLLSSPSIAGSTVDPAPVVAAERAFAEAGLKLGVKASFLLYAAPDAIVFQPDPVNAQATYRAGPDDAGDPPLVWWPVWAGVARSGDLGFTTGPFTYGGKPGGFYFTVWRRQPDGGWKWIFDGGTPTSAEGAAPPGSQPDYLPVSTIRGRYPEAAKAEVRRIEAKLASTAQTDVTAAYLRVLAPDARVVGSRAPASNTAQARAAELATRPSKISFTPIGGQASGAGDLAWTYGDARWSQDGHDRRGHYVRIWQLRRGGWKLIADELLPVRAAS